jgi:hypothetical protein
MNSFRVKISRKVKIPGEKPFTNSAARQDRQNSKTCLATNRTHIRSYKPERKGKSQTAYENSLTLWTSPMQRMGCTPYC